MDRIRYAARLNSFASGAHRYWPGTTSKPSVVELLQRAATVKGLSAVDLNFPDHVSPASLAALEDLGLTLNGFAMRYYREPAFKLGAFTHPDEKVRRLAIDDTKRALDGLGEVGGKLLTIWLGQDGFDYAFQADYGRLWDHTVAAFQEVADHAPGIDVSIEYKPNEPRSFSLMPDLGMTLVALDEIDRPNLGATLDICHVVMADEMPAYAARMVARRSRLLGIHLNDSYGKRDDGLMVGAVHLLPTLELFVELERIGYRGVIYFDTFPDTAGADPVAECARNIATTDRLAGIARRLASDPTLSAAVGNQDAIASLGIVQEALFGR